MAGGGLTRFDCPHCGYDALNLTPVDEEPPRPALLVRGERVHCRVVARHPEGMLAVIPPSLGLLLRGAEPRHLHCWCEASLAAPDEATLIRRLADSGVGALQTLELRLEGVPFLRFDLCELRRTLEEQQESGWGRWMALAEPHLDVFHSGTRVTAELDHEQDVPLLWPALYEYGSAGLQGVYDRRRGEWVAMQDVTLWLQLEEQRLPLQAPWPPCPHGEHLGALLTEECALRSVEMVVRDGRRLLVFQYLQASTKLSDLQTLAEGGDSDAQVRLAEELLLENRDAEAEEWLNQAAAEENAEAFYWLGKMRAEGRNQRIHLTEALEWFQKAAERGHVGAQLALGVRFYKGQGVRASTDKALPWLLLAAEADQTEALFLLGCIFSRGERVDADPVRGGEYYRRAAEHGHEFAQVYLAHMLRDGRLPYDPRQAADLYRQAAEAGSDSAMYYLAQLYERGEGVEKDTRQALALYEKAALLQHTEAAEALRSLQRRRPSERP